MGSHMDLPGSAKQLLAANVLLLKPEDQVFTEMVRGWNIQQQSRMLKAETIEARSATVRRFAAYTNEYPWRWTAQDVDEWTANLAGERHLAHSSIRGIQNGLRLFMEYLIDPNYAWVDECRRRFNEVPVQICHEWNTVEHLGEFEGRPSNRPFTRSELQAFFDEADARVAAARKARRKGALAAFRCATMLKVAYAWGLRRRELVMLDIVDLGRNPAAPEFGPYGYIHVRYGKALRGGPPRRRTVLTTMPWAVEALSEYIDRVRPKFGFENLNTLWPTERGGRVSVFKVDEQFIDIRDALGLPPELRLHCLRHSYVTHLIEDGWDARFVQEQVGHAYASTTAIYTGVSNDFKNRVLRDALDSLYDLGSGTKERQPK
jgi:integrase/recombinase XerC